VKKLPEFINKYFWDAEFEKIDLQKHRVCVLRRILEYGDDVAHRGDLCEEFRYQLSHIKRKK
jgi:hypothetical protein